MSPHRGQPSNRDPGRRLTSFLRELKRRRVYRVGAAYAAGAFVLWQVAAIVVPALELPDWLMTAVVVGAIAGFPVAVALAWAFEVTPGGVRRTRTAEADGAEAAEVEATGVGAARMEAAPEEATGTPPPRGRLVARPSRLAGAAAVLVGAGLLTWWLWPHASLGFTAGDPVMVADFENRTGDTIFDRSLNTAFRISLEQSPFLNVYPRRKVEDALRRMRRDPATPVTGPVAAEIARRDGLPVAVLPSISGVGDRYALGFEVLEPGTGETMATELVRVDGKEEVLEGVDELALRLRDYLGESLSTIEAHHKELARVTTRSLDALELFSLANEHQRNAEWEDARRLFSAALEVDSGFTAARAQLGMVELERFDREEGKRLLKAAIRDVDGLTDYEAFGIRGFYADAVEGDLEKAADIYRTLTDMYPQRAPAHNNLGWVLSRDGRAEDAVAHYRRALRLDPSLNLTYLGLSHILLYSLGRVDTALALAKERVRMDSSFVWAWDQLGWAYLGVDSLEAARAAFERALELNPRVVIDLYRLGHVHRLAGRPAEAVASFRRVLEVDTTEHSANYVLGLMLRKIGEEAAARRHFEAFLRVTRNGVEAAPDYAYNYIDVALTLIRLGEEERGRAMARKALEVDSASADVHMGLALVAGARGREEEALERLRGAFQRGYTNYIWAKIHPDLEVLYDEPGFRELIDRKLNR